MVKAIDGYTTDGYIAIKELTSSRSVFKCATCDNHITEWRSMKFPICDECMKDLRGIISERRKPKVVVIGGVEYIKKRSKKNDRK